MAYYHIEEFKSDSSFCKRIEIKVFVNATSFFEEGSRVYLENIVSSKVKIKQAIPGIPINVLSNIVVLILQLTILLVKYVSLTQKRFLLWLGI